MALRTLRVRFADRPDHDLAFEAADDEADPWTLLKSQIDSEGLINLGDRDSCKVEDVLDVVLVEPQPLEGHGYERGLQDEDVATALEESYDSP
jgi:hypothetical protein